MKRRYSEAVRQRKAEAAADQVLADAIARGKARSEAYSENWQEIDLTEFALRFAPGAKLEMQVGKLYIQTPGSPLRIVADIGGGYCRLEDTTKKGVDRYLGIDGKPLPHNYVGEDGKQHGLPPAKRKALPHFKIKKGIG